MCLPLGSYVDEETFIIWIAKGFDRTDVGLIWFLYAKSC